MVYPVSSAAPQQIPAANTFQPGSQTETTKRPEQDSRVTQSNEASAQSLTVKTLEKDSAPIRASSSERSEDTGGVSGSTTRGTTFDLSV